MKIFIIKSILVALLSCSLIASEEKEVFKGRKDLILSPEAYDKVHNEKSGRLFVYTYPRSGTHWITYILKYFTQRLVTFPFQDELFDRNHHDLTTDLSKPSIHSNHIYSSKQFEKYHLPAVNYHNDKILLVVRNPLESLIRFEKHVNNKSVTNIITHLKNNRFELYDNLKFFEKWPHENKLLIYYEDLLSYPEREIEKLLVFLDEPLDRLPDFIENLQWHLDRTVDQYDRANRHTGGSHSKGQDLLYHSRGLSIKQRKKLFELLKSQKPDLFQKYLSRYENLYD